MAQFEIEYLDPSNNQERIEIYNIDTMLFDAHVDLMRLWQMALYHADKSKKDPEYISRIEFLAW